MRHAACFLATGGLRAVVHGGVGGRGTTEETCAACLVSHGGMHNALVADYRHTLAQDAGAVRRWRESQGARSRPPKIEHLEKATVVQLDDREIAPSQLMQRRNNPRDICARGHNGNTTNHVLP